MTLSQAFDWYRLDVIEYSNQSDKVLESHEFARKLLVDFVGDIEIESLTLMQTRAWKRSLDNGRKVGTVREYLTRLRMVLKFLRDEGNGNIINYNRVTLPPRDDPDPQFLTVDQVQKLIEAVFEPARGYSTANRYRNRALLQFLFASGLRSAEIRSLNKEDIRSDNTFKIRGKRKKMRPCYIDETTRHYLEEYFRLRTDDNPALFVSEQNGKRLSKSTFQRIFENARKKVDFPVDVHGHIMRHSFATDLLRNGANIRYVQELLGHSSIQTTQIYTHVVNADLRSAHQAYHTKLPVVNERGRRTLALTPTI